MFAGRCLDVWGWFVGGVVWFSLAVLLGYFCCLPVGLVLCGLAWLVISLLCFVCL